MRLTVQLAVVASLANASAHAQTLLRTINGPATQAQFGKACIEISDQNADGYKDVLVGAPGYNQQRGAIYCISGAYLALGTGSSSLWSIFGTGNQGNLLGYALAEIPDATGDGVKDILVGEPGYDISGANDVGAVRLINGVSHALGAVRYGAEQGGFVGAAIAASAQRVVVGAPGPISAHSYVFIHSPQTFASSGSIVTINDFSGNGSEELGFSIADVDVDGNGHSDIVVGSPGGGTGGGVLVLFFNATGGGSVFWTSYQRYSSQVAGERMGHSVDAAHDYDGDGKRDIVAGAPNSPNGPTAQVGRAVVLSGHQLDVGSSPYELYTLTPPTTDANLHFGEAVSASDDLNNDGVGDFLISAPDYSFAGSAARGMTVIYSGSSGSRVAHVTGSNADRQGDGLTGAIRDLDGDGFKEFVVAGSLSDVNGTNSGILKCYRLFPVTPFTYCTPKINSLGCTPFLGFSGMPSESSSLPFAITASSIINQKNGLLFYSHAPTSVAFQGGFKCVANPTVRTPVQGSGGATTGSSCTGAYSFDFNAWIDSGFDPSLGAGAEVYAQYWSRDPVSPSATSLTNAVRFLINP